MKKFRLIWVGICASLMLMDNACAYIDPSVMTYTIQVVAGVVVAVSAVIGVYWRRFKRNVQNKLGIDGNAKKEIEPDVIEIMAEE